MRTQLSVLVASTLIAACMPGAQIPRAEAETTAAQSYTSMRHVDQRSGKLMTWAEWKGIGLAGHGDPGLNVRADQLVWVVALHDREVPDAVVIVLDAVSGSQIMVSTGPWRWPPYWDQVPDRAR